MYVFIATIFIAELIIVGFLINLFLKWDKKVICCSEYVSNCGTDILKVVREVKDILCSATNIICNITGFVENKKKLLKNKLINLSIIYLLLIVLKLKFKRAAKILQYVLIAKDFWESIPG